MNTRALCITVLVFTILIFAGNHHTAMNGFQSAECVKCNCFVKLKFPETVRGKDPSCSVVFKIPAPYAGTFTQVFNLSRLTKTEGSFEECDTAVVCDKNSEAELKCRGSFGDETKEPKTVVWTQTKCSVRCERRGDIKVAFFNCDHWERKPPKKKSPPNKQGSRSPADRLGFLPFGSRRQSSSTFPTLLPASYNQQSPLDEDPSLIVGGSAWWRPLEGDIGMDQNVLTVATGQALVSSFCTGDTLLLNGPGTFTLPMCQVDSLGIWRGAYARRLPNGDSVPVAVNLNLRREGRALGGELTTPEGTFNVVSVRQTSSNIELNAAGTIGGKPREIQLLGQLNKGDIVFSGREGSRGDISTPIIGFVRRLYISNSGLPPGVLNQPYVFTLSAFSPFSKTVTLRLAEGTLPRGISLDSQSGMLKGTPLELGNFNFRVAATDTSGNSFEQPLTLAVKKLALVTRTLPDAFVGQPYAATLKVSGGRPPYRFSGTVPSGLKLDPNTGEVTGTPTRPDGRGFAIFIGDSQNTADSDILSLPVRGTTILTSHFLPDATKGGTYRAQFQAIGNTSPINWSISGGNIGSIGLALDPQTGELSGRPTKSGTFLISVLAQSDRYQSSGTHTRKFALTVSP